VRLGFSRYRPIFALPLVSDHSHHLRSVAFKDTSPGIPARSHTGLRPEDTWRRWDGRPLLLSPWASDGFFLLVYRLPGWPQAMWGHRRPYCVTSAFGD